MMTLPTLQPPACTWLVSTSLVRCSARALYLVELTTAAGTAFTWHTCVAHLGRLVQRSVMNPAIVQVTITRGGVNAPAAPESRQDGRSAAWEAAAGTSPRVPEKPGR